MSSVDPFPSRLDTANVRWFDANVRHQIGLIRVGGGIKSKVWELLDATETDVRRAIAERLRHYSGTFRPADKARLKKLVEEIALIRGTAWKDVRQLWREEMNALVIAEPRFMDALLKGVVPVQLQTTLPVPAVLRALVVAKPFEGKTLAGWAANVNRADVQRINSQIQIGLVQGESLPDITRRVVGTVRLKGVDGVTQIARQQAEAITRTAVNHFANQSRQLYFLENADIVDTEVFIATLDGSTTPICRATDGERFPLGEGLIPPLHIRCRSIRTAALDDELIGDRPMKPVTERMLLREFADREGFEPVTSRDDLPRGTKAKFDSFARKRTRELIGRVPAKTTYQQFLTRQNVEFQDDVLGRTRARLFRDGGLNLKSFVDRTGKEIPLRELAKMHAAAFRAAGIDIEGILAGA